METLRGIQQGSVRLAFRRWRRPTVKAGGTLLTAVGQLAIEAVDVVDPDGITPEEAAAAGFGDVRSLKEALGPPGRGDVYRIRLSLAGPDPRITLREQIPDAEELAAVAERLRRMDSRSASGPWTRRVLELIDARPETRAGDLAAVAGVEQARLKLDVRRLKSIGLTESLRVGYRLSPRGRAVLKHLRSGA